MVYLQILGGFVLLLGGAEFLVRGAVQVAAKAGLSAMLIGMTVVAFGTSAPEFVVSLNASLDGKSGLAMGNIIGSNIANVFLILGVTAMFTPIVVNVRAVIRDALMVMGSTILFAWVSLTGEIGSMMGGTMFLILVAYFVFSYMRERKGNHASAQLHEHEAEEVQDIDVGMPMAWVFLIGGLVAVAYGAELLVSGGTVVARGFGVSEEVIGLTLIAFGTSLPELAASVMAALRGHTDVAIGNVIGSNLFNLMCVGGGVAFIVPLSVPEQLQNFDLWVMMAATVLLLAYLTLGKRIGRVDGIVFTAIYGVYITTQAVGVDKVMGMLS
ncbi:MAG: conjugal transfer protein TraR [Rhodospirillaceae bacterium]|nr:MAG: conjugal transfer protein TraR [Rhodospirillaceae bacterium]